MAFIENTMSFRLGGKGATGYDSEAYANVTLTTRAGEVQWSIKMETPANGSGRIAATKLEFYIDETKVYDNYYTNYGQGFPCKNGSTASGAVTLKSANSTSIPIIFNIGVSTSSPQYKKSVTLTRVYYTNVGAGSVKVTDNYNNSFTITATKGSNGTNNPAGGPDTLKWGYDTNYNSSYISGRPITFTPSGTASTRTVYAKARTTAEYGSAQTATTSASVKQYVGPNAPTGQRITYSKTRFTLKENWTLSWTAPSINNGCPVKGYRIRLYRRRGAGAFVKLPIFGSDGKYLSTKVVSSGDVYYDRDGTSTSLIIYPAFYSTDVHPDEPDILPGDVIKFAVTAYTKYGKDYDGSAVDSDGSKIKFKTSEAPSGEYTVQNAGVMRVKQGSAWKEGQVYIKVAGAWKEADVVSARANGKWCESE